MARQNVAYRLVSEGKATLINDFKEIGDSGNASAQRIGRAFERDAASAEAAIRKLEGTAAKLQSLQGPTVQDRINASTGISSGPSRDAAASARALFAEEDRLLAKRAALLAQIDPLFAAQQRYNAVMAEATTLRQRGIMTEQEFVRVQGVAKESLEQMTLAQDRMAATNGMVRAGWQQTGFQLQDIAIQYSMGTSSAAIFAMQSGQVFQALGMVAQGSEGAKGKLGSLLGFLAGPWGVGLGVAASVVGLVAVKLLETGEEADKTTGKLAKQITVVDRLRGAYDSLYAAMNKVDAQAAADADIRLRMDEAELSRAKAKVKAADDAYEASKRAVKGDEEGSLARLRQLRDAQSTVAELEERIATGRNALNLYQQRAGEIQAREAAERAKKDDAKSERERAKALRESEKAARAAERAQSEYAASLLGLEEKYDPAAAAARRYKDELLEIARLQAAGVIDRERAADFGMQARAAAFLPGLKDELAPDLKIEDDRTKDEERRREYAERIKQDMADQQSYLEAELVLVRASDAERAATLSKLRLMQDLRREGIDLESEDAQAILRANDALEEKTRILLEQQQAWEETKRFGEDMIDKVLNPQNWDDFGDVAKSVLKEIEAEFIKLALLNPIKNMLFGSGLPSLFGGGAGGGGGGMDVTASIGMAAVGTEYASGGMTWLAENGPELVHLPRGSRVTPAAETRRLLAGNDNRPSVNMPISINAPGADAAALGRVEAQLRQLRAELPATIVATVGDAQQRRILARAG